MIQLSKVGKSFDGVEVLHSIDLAVSAGESIVLIGPSGCGKSTLLRLMIGLLFPDQGSVKLLGQSVVQENLINLRQQVGFVLQNGGLFPHLTARENIELMANYLGRDPKWIKDRSTNLLELARLDASLLERYPRQLSGGQVQRVALMRALMLDPDILFLDEPLGALDPLHRASLQQDMKAIFETLKKTVVLVTHDMAEAAALGDRIVFMRAGKILQYDTLTHLIQNPADGFITEFINAQRKPWQSLEEQIS